MHHQRYFTIVTSRGAGIAHQLGTELDRLARLGHALGLRYVHTPLAFPRTHPPGMDGREWVRRMVSNARRTLGAPERGDQVASFLGLQRWERNVGDPEFRSKAPMDVDVSELLRRLEPSAGLEAMGALLPTTSEGSLLRLRLTGLDDLDLLDRLLASAEDRRSGFDIRDCYWARRETWPVATPWRGTGVRLLVHIRLGDSATVDIAGRQVKVREEEVIPGGAAEPSLAVDPNRRSVDVGEYRALLAAITQEFGSARFSPLLVSDGYRRTFRKLRKEARRGHPLLQGVTAADLRDSERRANAGLDAVLPGLDPSQRIIGESDAKLFQAIHGLATADIVVWGTGGFAYYMHELFSPREARTLALHVRDTAQPLERIAEFLESSEGRP